jgi:hypothetical protein
MTLEDLLQELLALTKVEREAELVIFDYAANEFLDMKTVAACRDGYPPFHLTIN